MNEDFLITCNRTYDPPTAFLRESNIDVTDIWLWGELRVTVVVAQDCYNQGGQYTRSGPTNYNQDSWINLSKFPISSTRNKFTAIGCDTYAWIKGYSGTAYATGCMSLCSNISDVVEGSCSGIGCCQTAIPKGVMDYRINVSSYFNHKDVYDFNPCSYAFVAEEGTYNFSSKDLKDFTKRNETTQVVLNWAIGNQTCTEAKKDHPQKFACKNNSDCRDSVNGPGYWCNCSEGFEGNPYLPNGCQDINECERNPNLCHKNSTCINLNGAYNCSCLPGYEDDGKEIDGSGCKPIPPPTPPPPIPKSQTTFPLMNRIALGVSVSLLLLLLGISWLYLGLRQRKHTKLKQKFFEQNGGFMLQQQLSRHKGSVETTRIFTAEELMKATNNYHENRILGQGGQGTVYKGILSDNRIVAIKKSRTIDRSQIEQFINEVIVLSQVNHRNVVKLLGCCLETQVPMLVYEFVTNGTLFNHIHHIDHSSTLQWQLRLQIATETAGALSYLHFAASTPIIHRDIKSTNVLLDDNYVAKVSDFGASRLVPLDQTQLTTLVQGTLGYLDPEYFQSSQLTEKSDVYSFGVLLAELLTGKKALSFDRPEAERNLAMHFVLAMKENRLFEILDRRVLNEGNAEQVMEVAMLVKRCLSLKGEERPTMKEVALELEGLKAMEKPPHVKGSISSKETEYLLSRPDDVCLSGANSDSACYDSIKSQVKISVLDDGR
ncbi:wall-associated receptor kinase 2-like [Castanea sativa]|uniref:wall-associated receptor kinase 2-like n=1 Tax=Castanea sativa TaxID=21020 RepID=UPI003F64C12B